MLQALQSPNPDETGGHSAPVTRLSILDIKNIEADAQVRKHFEPESLANLASSLRTAGQLVPILAYHDQDREKFIIIDGERRWRAAKQTGLSTLEAVIFPQKPTEAEISLVQITIDSQRDSLDAIDQALGFSRVMKSHHWSLSELAANVHLASSTITRSLVLLGLPIDFQDLIRAGQLPPGVARELARLPTEAQQREVYHQVKKEALSSEQTQKLVSKLLKPKSKRGRPKSKDNRIFKNLGGFEAIITPRKLTLSTTSKAKSKEQMLAAVELLAVRLREEIANNSTQPEPAESVEALPLPPA